MKGSFKFILPVTAGLIILTVAAGPLYVIHEGEQAVIVQMGKLVDVVREAGLHGKLPLVEQVVRYPKRILSWDGEQKSMPTREKQYIWVDVTARWRISDPKKFYESISTVGAAYSKLAEIIDSEVRTVVAEHYLRETVRNSNIIMERSAAAPALELGAEIDPELIGGSLKDAAAHEPIRQGRRQLAEEILSRSRRMMSEYGIELIDVVTRQIRYSDELTQSVYARMIKERNQIAQAFRSEGEGKKALWLGRMDNERRSILSAAYEKAEAIRGTADAAASRIYAEAYSQDRGFFDFWRGVESYRATIPGFHKVLSTDMDYFKYLYSPDEN